ncbi:hypothetical protein Hanom_Chr08g00713251 [Helianthus anomalus]
MRNHGVAAVANSILNAMELDQAVAALTDVACAALHQHFGAHHCSVTDQADEMLARAKEVYDKLSLPVMDLVVEALKHDDYVARLKSILMVPETVELSDEEETAGGGGGE